MDERQYLIRTFQRGSWEVKTRSIENIEPSGDKYRITFANNNQVYSYGRNKVQYFKNPEVCDIAQSVVRIRGAFGKSWDEARIFGPYTCLYRGDYCRVENKKDIEIIPNISSKSSVKNLKDYYYAIANFVGNETPHLKHYYETRLDVIRDDSVLSQYIHPSSPAKSLLGVPIYPFGINPSQRKAVINALVNQISLIQGPPGTGKTQTILNIIANLIFRGKTVAIVAGNNSATENVLEKLQALGLGFIAARLGRNELQDEFFSREHALPGILEWEISEQERKTIDHRIADIDGKIISLLEAKNRYAVINEFISRLEIEKKYFDKHFVVSAVNPRVWSFANKWATPNLLEFLAELEYHSQFEKVSWPTKLRWLYKYHIYKFKDLKTISNTVIQGVVAEFYNQKMNELQQEQEALKELLETNNFERLLEMYRRTSLKLFKGYIAKHYKNIEDLQWDSRSYKSNFSGFMNRFPVLLSTTDSIVNNKAVCELFDYVIVDEASQVDLVTGFLTMSCAKNIVAVGDLNQLPHIPNKNVVKSNQDIDRQFGIKGGYSYVNQSLLSSITKIFSDDVPTTLLVEHYRCHPRIIDFCNQKFYDGKLVTMTEATGDPFAILKTVRGNHARRTATSGSQINNRELDVIEKEVLQGCLKNEPATDIGITSPYRAQADEAKARLAKDGLKIDTVYKFQGREMKNIVFTTTSNSLNNFVDDPHLLNVAVSRAIDRFVLVTSRNSFKKQGSNLGDLIRHIEYQSLSPVIFESKIISIFDCLYDEYSDVLKGFLAKVQKKSRFPSENLMSTLLDELLAMKPFKSFSYKTNYRLNLLISDYGQFTARQEEYARHPNTHVDFLVFNKLDKLPVLAIEVDGYKYHKLNDKQQERDELKDQIFKYLDIPLSRFSTTGSGEKARLEKALNKLLQEIPESKDEKLKS